MILTFADHDGDPVAVESSSIVGLSVGTVNGPHPAPDPIRVTLIWAAGAAQPFMVAEPFADVAKAWELARQAGGTGGMPGFHGWPVHPAHPSSLLTGPASWAAKEGAR